MSFQGSIAIPDALDAMEKNLRQMITLAGRRPGVVRAVADSGAHTASINHQTQINGTIDCQVRFPIVPASYRMTKGELDRWTGYFLHEVSHALYTDEAAWRRACGEGLSALVNGLEDVRIERKLNKATVAANSFDLLNALMSWAVDEAAGEADPNDGRNLPWTLASVGRRVVCGYDLPALDSVLARMSPEMRAVVDGALAEVRKASDTNDVLKIARRLTGRNPETGERPQPQPSDKPAQPSDKPTEAGSGAGEPDEGEGEGSGAGSADTNEDGSDSVSDKPAKGSPQPGADKGDDEGEGDKGGAGSGSDSKGDTSDTKGTGEDTSEDEPTAPTPLTFDPATMVEIKLDPTSADTKKAAQDMQGGSYDDARNEGWLIEIIRRAGAQNGRTIPAYDHGANPAVVVASAQRCATLRQHVARVVKSVETESWHRNTAAGRINRFAFARIGAGATENVYAKRSISEGFETEIVIVCDGSSSMAGGKLDIAATLALVVAQACEQQGVKCEVVQFVAGRLATVKATKDRASGKLSMFGRLAGSVGGGTPLSESLIVMATRLANRAPTKRKIMFAMTDGACDSGSAVVRKACDYAERLGVETIGLTIDAPKHGGFRYEARVSSRDDVASVGLGHLVRALEGRAPQ